MCKFKLILIAIFSVICMSVHAKHLEFMGIPISGTITSFQTKLQAKGCTISKTNNQYPSGIRVFNGVFAGKDCKILVWYNHRTKQVYKVRAISDCVSSEVAHDTFNYYKDLLNKKYEGKAINSDIFENTSNDEYDFSMAVMQPPIEVGSKVLGFIGVFIIDYDNYPRTYGVAITYEDFEGTSKNEQNTLDDL